MIFYEGYGLIQEYSVPEEENSLHMYKDHVWGVDVASKFPRSQSSWASMGRAGHVPATTGGFTSLITGLKASAPNSSTPLRSLVQSVPMQDQHSIRPKVAWLVTMTHFTFPVSDP